MTSITILRRRLNVAAFNYAVADIAAQDAIADKRDTTESFTARIAALRALDEAEDAVVEAYNGGGKHGLSCS